MTDDEGLIAAIRADPAAEMPRLAYADWLDEHGQGERDAARAEFIRLSCGVGYNAKRTKVRIGVNEGKWLDANWTKLVPRFVAGATPEHWEERLFAGGDTPRLVQKLAGGITATRSGRVIRAKYYWSWNSARPAQPSLYSGFTISLTFWHGFLTTFEVYGLHAFGLVAGLIAADEPLAEPRFLESLGATVWNDERTDAVWQVTNHRSGVVFPHVTGHDATVKAGALVAKSFDRRPDEAPEEICIRGMAAVERAAAAWMRENRGLSVLNARPTWEVERRDEVVVLPIDRADRQKYLNTGGS